ncbi:MAG: hypothetical protein JWN86_1480 [Planctomycetota bacterium]|nr:hypothetical protein [Planctomycetota bacterium]
MVRATKTRLRWTIASMMVLIAWIALPIGGYAQIKREQARREAQVRARTVSTYLERLAKDLAATPPPRPAPIYFHREQAQWDTPGSVQR